MTIRAHDPERQTLHHHCDHCHAERHLHHADITVTEGALMLPECPACGSVEGLRRGIPAWEAGEGNHPGSLVGTVLEGANGIPNIVREHQVGYHLLADSVAQCQHIRAIEAALLEAQPLATHEIPETALDATVEIGGAGHATPEA